MNFNSMNKDFKCKNYINEYNSEYICYLKPDYYFVWRKSKAKDI